MTRANKVDPSLLRWFVAILYRPLSILGLVAVVAHHTIPWYLFEAGCLITDFLITDQARMILSMRNALAASQDFKQRINRSITLEELGTEEIDRLVPKDLMNLVSARFRGVTFNTRARRRDAGVPEKFPAVRIFCATSGDLFDYHAAYISYYGPSYIVLFERPQNVNVIEKFCLYHELSHATADGVSAACRQYSTTARFYFAACALISCTAHSLAWGSFAIVSVPILFKALFRKDIDAELYADTEALHALDASDAVEVANALTDVWEKDAKYQRQLADEDRLDGRDWKRRALRAMELEERRDIMAKAKNILSRPRWVWANIFEWPLFEGLFAQFLVISTWNAPAISPWACFGAFILPIWTLLKKPSLNEQTEKTYAAEANFEQFIAEMLHRKAAPDAPLYNTSTRLAVTDFGALGSTTTVLVDPNLDAKSRMRQDIEILQLSENDVWGKSPNVEYKTKMGEFVIAVATATLDHGHVELKAFIGSEVITANAASASSVPAVPSIGPSPFLMPVPARSTWRVEVSSADQGQIRIKWFSTKAEVTAAD